MSQSQKHKPYSLLLWKRSFSSASKFSRRHIRLLRAVPNTLAAILWTTMLLYFTVWYTTQPRISPPDNPSSPPSIPKPCHAFSLWPYISCVGQHEELVFRGVCISMALLISFSFILLYHLTRPIKEGKWLRRGSTGFALVSSVALVALTYQLIDESPLPHLVTTSGQIFTMFLCKCFDWGSNLMVRRAWRRRMGGNHRIRPLEVSRWAKIAVAAFTIGICLSPHITPTLLCLCA